MALQRITGTRAFAPGSVGVLPLFFAKPPARLILPAGADIRGEPHMELRSNLKLLNYARKFLLNDTENILPFPVRPQKPRPAGRLPDPLPRVTPREAGVPAQALTELFRGLAGKDCGTHACMVLRDGKVVAEGGFAPYTTSLWHVTHSMCKSITGTAIGMLIDENLLRLDERVCDIFPEKCSLLTSRRMRAITVRQLLTMTSGASFKETGAVLETDWVKGFIDGDVLFEPGSKFDYNSMNSYMLSAIVKKKTGQGLTDYLRPRLFEPLGFGDAAWETCPQGIEKGGWGLYIYLEDIAKIGLMYMNKGLWTMPDGSQKRILSESWIAEATKPDTVHENGEEYGFQLWPHSIDRTYLFNGMFGQYVIIAPEHRLVIAVNAGAGNLFTHSRTYTSACAFVKALAGAPVPLAADPEAEARLAFTLSHLRFGEPIPEMPAAQKTPWYVRLQSMLRPPRPAPAQSPIPDGARPALAKSYAFEKNRAGLLPLILGCMEDSYTKGVSRAAFEQSGDALTLVWTEGGVEYRIPIGFDAARECSLNIGGNVWAVGALGRFTTDEDDQIVLKLSLCYLESSSTRLLKFIFSDDGRLTLKCDETPGLLLAMQSMADTVRNLPAGADWFKDLDYMQYLIRRVCVPVVRSSFSVREDRFIEA